MCARDTQDVFAQVPVHFLKLGMREFQILLLGADESSAVARQEKSCGSGLARCITIIVSDYPSARTEGSISEAKEVLCFRIIEMMHQPESKDNVESTELLNRMMAYALTDKFASITVTLPCGGNARRIGIHAEILALGKKWQHVAGPAADIQNTIMGLRPNVLPYQHPAPVIGADQ